MFTQEPPLKTFTGTPMLTMKVAGYGSIEIKLYPESAPYNVSNVFQLAASGFYDGLTFHRVIPGFVIQGGDPKGTGMGGPSYTVKGEIREKHVRGVMAMARTGDSVNPQRRSSGSQFYFALKDLPSLDAGGYTVIGKVVSGMEVVDAVARAQTDAHDKPRMPVVMEKVTATEQ